MSESEKATLMLRQLLSERELKGELSERDAIRLIEALQEIDSILE